MVASSGDCTPLECEDSRSGRALARLELLPAHEQFSQQVFDLAIAQCGGFHLIRIAAIELTFGEPATELGLL
mgnify:CR=1 FL=1